MNQINEAGIHGSADLKGKTALVTGAASGIGFATARCLIRAGATVCLADINEDAVESSAMELNNAGGSAVPLVMDVSSESAVRSVSEKIFRETGGVDILVNNAGLQHVSPVESFPVERWDLLQGVLLRGAFLCTQQFLPRMTENGWGRIINIASIHSIVASQFKSAYVSAKHGLLGFTKTVALEAAAKGVTVNAISPAYVRTPLVEQQIDAQAKLHSISREAVITDIMLAPMPQKELIEPDEIGETVIFLCSNSARHINGHNLVIDGGWTIT
ncbi:MAG TPA: 3-hydroxybutyrate dehydrogenase [Pyrinomonadaceae bacterium]|nr:3-hydroxybutyrate dehydrogenase [Pyrinomonadaceae bacterium]